MSALAEAAGRIAAAPAGWVRLAGAALRSAALITLASVVVAAVYVTWIRDLPIFQVSSVKITGTNDGLIINTLTTVAQGMTTLHVRQDRLDEAAGHFPVIGSVHAEPAFPTGLRLEVEIREPVALASIDGAVVAVAGDGTLLPGVDAPGRLPTVEAIAKDGVLQGHSAAQVRVLGAAPAPLLGLVSGIETDERRGIAVQMKGGVELRFGTDAGAAQKWAAAAAVLADDRLAGLAYIDVSAPERPAVGGAVGGPPIEVEVDVAPTQSVASAPTTEDTVAESVPPAGEVDSGATAAPVSPELPAEEAAPIP